MKLLGKLQTIIFFNEKSSNICCRSVSRACSIVDQTPYLSPFMNDLGHFDDCRDMEHAKYIIVNYIIYKLEYGIKAECLELNYLRCFS